MGKVVSSYSSVVRGVSEQVPQDRHPGQHYEQINMVSDPVRGTARRHGSKFLAEQLLPGFYSTDDPHIQEIVDGMREYSFFMKGKEYSLIYQSKAVAFPTTLPIVNIYSKDENKFLNVWIDTTGMGPYQAQGLGAITTVGDYLLASGNNLTAAYSQVDQYAASLGQGSAWIKGGAYSRTYTLGLTSKATGASTQVQYTTKASSYPTLLDTSDILTENPPGTINKDYQKQVNDRVNAYNSAATAWIGQAYADQQPSNIMQQLVLLVSAFCGANGIGIAWTGNSAMFSGLSQLSTGDGGDSSLFVNVLDEITSPDKVTAQHFYNKVVKVRAPGAIDAYYLKASQGALSAGLGPVTWVEAPAQIVTPTAVFCLGRLSADGNTFFFAASPARLTAISGIAGTPTFAPTHAGDLSAVGSKPYFLDHPITAMTVFQDRLTIISNGVIFMSKSGDYFNWFRGSSLTVDDSDPVEMYALGTEDDIITKSVTYNKALFLFGNRNQYVIAGTTAITSKNANVSPAAAEHGANYCRPAVSGNLLFYGRSKRNTNNSYRGAVAQFQLGLFEDSPETYTASAQLDKYILGKPIELTALVEPTTLFVRTDGNPFGLYVYSFIDNPGNGQREFDSWSQWKWEPHVVGRIAGLVAYDSALIVYTYRHDGNGVWIAAEQFTMDSDLSELPYMDSLRPYPLWNQTTPMTFRQIQWATVCGVSMDNNSVYYLMGASNDPAKIAAFATQHVASVSAMWTGGMYDAYVDLTPPYIRDQNDRAYTTGELTIGQYVVSVVDTAGLDAYRTSEAVTTVVKKFNGRILGQPNTTVGRQPVATTNIFVPCGKSNVRHRMLLRARTWLPMCISAIEWSGQSFFNSRRV